MEHLARSVFQENAVTNRDRIGFGQEEFLGLSSSPLGERRLLV